MVDFSIRIVPQLPEATEVKAGDDIVLWQDDKMKRADPAVLASVVPVPVATVDETIAGVVSNKLVSVVGLRAALDAEPGKLPTEQSAFNADFTDLFAGWQGTIIPGKARSSIAVNLASLLDFDGSDEGAALNAILAGSPAGTRFFVPRNLTLRSSIAPLFGVQGQRVDGLKLKLLNNVGALSAALLIQHDDITFEDLEVDANAGLQSDGTMTNQTNSMPCIRSLEKTASTSSPKRLRFLGRTFLRDTSNYTAQLNNNCEHHFEHLVAEKVWRDGLHAQNNSAGTNNTAPIVSVIDRADIDRSGYPGNYPAIQVLGTTLHPSQIDHRNITIKGAIDPPSNHVNIEYRYGHGSLRGAELRDGNIGITLGYGMKGFGLYSPRCIGGVKIGVEVASDQAGNVGIFNPVIYGAGTDGVLRLERGIALDGTPKGSRCDIVAPHVEGVREHGLFIDRDGWDEVRVIGGNIVCTGMDGASSGQMFGISLDAADGVAGPSNVHLAGVEIDMAGAADYAIHAANATNLTGEVTVRNATGGIAPVRFLANGLASGVDKVALRVNIGDGCPATDHIVFATANGGTLGSSIRVSGSGLRGTGTAQNVEWLDLANGLMRGFGGTSPEGVLDAAVGSTFQLRGVGTLFKSTALGTLTGWVDKSRLGPVTFANLATTYPPATYQGRFAWVTDIGPGGSEWVSNGGAWNPVGEVWLGGSGAAIAHTGDTVEHLFASVTVPVGLLANGRRIEGEATWGMTGSTNSKTVRVRFGGTLGSGTAHASLAITTASIVNNEQPFSIRSRDAANAQVSPSLSLLGNGGNASTAVVTNTFNNGTTVGYVSITGTLASAAESITLESWRAVLKL